MVAPQPAGRRPGLPAAGPAEVRAHGRRRRHRGRDRRVHAKRVRLRRRRVPAGPGPAGAPRPSAPCSRPPDRRRRSGPAVPRDRARARVGGHLVRDSRALPHPGGRAQSLDAVLRAAPAVPRPPGRRGVLARHERSGVAYRGDERAVRDGVHALRAHARERRARVRVHRGASHPAGVRGPHRPLHVRPRDRGGARRRPPDGRRRRPVELRAVRAPRRAPVRLARRAAGRPGGPLRRSWRLHP